MALQFHCPGCHLEMQIGEEFVGYLVACPTCGTKFRVPDPGAEAVAPDNEQPALEEPSHEPAEQGPSDAKPSQIVFAEYQESPLAFESIEDEPAPAKESKRHDERKPEPAAHSDDSGRRKREKPHAAESGPAEERHDKPLSKVAFHIDPEELIDMTAMVDIVFFLLIFFLVTSMQVMSSSIAMPNPDPQQGAGAAAAEPSTLEQFEDNDEYVVIHIDKNNALDIDGNPFANLNDLPQKLREMRETAPHPTKLLVVGDGDASHGVMVSVLDAGHEAGMDKVRMAVAGQGEDE